VQGDKAEDVGAELLCRSLVSARLQKRGEDMTPALLMGCEWGDAGRAPSSTK